MVSVQALEPQAAYAAPTASRNRESHSVQGTICGAFDPENVVLKNVVKNVVENNYVLTGFCSESKSSDP